MATFVTINEAASYLDVSKATLRNWDKSGKLKAVRDPINQYRVYKLADIQKIRLRLPINENDEQPKSSSTLTARNIRAFVARLHNILRDSDSHSNIIERFDELTKILFLKLYLEDRGSDLPSRDTSESDSGYAERIRKEYAKTARQNKKQIPEGFSILNASDEAICQCSEALAQVTFKNVSFDIKGLAYEEVIKNTFDKTDNQQFFTPPAIVKFMVEFMGQNLQGDICDPAAGTGGFLIEILKSDCPYKSLTGFEIDERLAWISGINLSLHGAEKASSHWFKDGGTLGPAAKNYFEKFDAIITNPPFGSDLSDTDKLLTFSLGKGRTSRRRGILFLERCHQLLKEGGKLGFIIDEGVLNASSTEDVRQFLSENFVIEAIVSLPETAFMPYATVNASILFLSKKGNAKKKAELTFFAKAENIGRKGNGDDDVVYDQAGNARLNSDFPEILEAYQNFKLNNATPSSELSYMVNVADIQKEDGPGCRLDFRFHHPSRKNSQTHLKRATSRLLALSELCVERNQNLIPSSDMADQNILYTGLANIESYTGRFNQVITPANSLKSAVKRYEPDDIIFAKMRPNLRKVAHMSVQEGGYVSSECVVLTVRKDENDEPIIDPFLLSVLLRADLVYGQIMHLVAGIGRPRLSGTDLRKIRIPSISSDKQALCRKEYLKGLDIAAKLKNEAADLLEAAARKEKDAVEALARVFAS